MPPGWAGPGARALSGNRRRPRCCSWPGAAARRPGEQRGAGGGPRGLSSGGSRTRRRRRGRPPGGDASPRGAPAPGRAETERERAGSGSRSGAAGPRLPAESGCRCRARAPRANQRQPPPRRSPCDSAPVAWAPPAAPPRPPPPIGRPLPHVTAGPHVSQVCSLPAEGGGGARRAGEGSDGLRCRGGAASSRRSPRSRQESHPPAGEGPWAAVGKGVGGGDRALTLPSWGGGTRMSTGLREGSGRRQFLPGGPCAHARVPPRAGETVQPPARAPVDLLCIATCARPLGFVRMRVGAVGPPRPPVSPTLDGASGGTAQCGGDAVAGGLGGARFGPAQPIPSHAIPRDRSGALM